MKDAEIVALYWDRNEVAIQQTQQKYGAYLSKVAYQYDITLEPGERMVNTVTAPIYPSIDIGQKPPIYEYTYLLSPAQT